MFLMVLALMLSSRPLFQLAVDSRLLHHSSKTRTTLFVDFVTTVFPFRVATATFVEALCGLQHVTPVQKALRCQRAEHTFANMPCGIMDQFISAMGVHQNLLLIDCRSNEFELVPFGAAQGGARGPVILVTNSNVQHSLSGSEYPDRVRQCNAAVAALQKAHPGVVALRDATMEMLEAVRDELSPTVYSRAKHCITEDQRTLATVAALRREDFATVGRCMTESHVSLKEEYEVSCPEIDFLVDLALQVPGVLGSRITGGGFGGCTVTLVERDSVAILQQFLRDHYAKQTGCQCEFYVAEPSAGAGFVLLGDEKSSGTAGTAPAKATLVAKVGETHARGAVSRYLLPATLLVVVAAVASGVLLGKTA